MLNQIDHIIDVCLLGLIQGLTEFLPVSSSGHLALAQKLFSTTSEGSPLLLTTILHGGTLLSVCIAFKADLVELATGFFNGRRGSLKYVGHILATTLVTAVIGLFGKPLVEQSYQMVWLIGTFWLVTALLLWMTDKAPEKNKSLNISYSLLIGLIQGLAIFPGLSRSGLTIIACLFLGLSRNDSVKYAFLISIPAILGGIVLELSDFDPANYTQETVISYSLGFFVAALTGYATILLLRKLVIQGKLKYFSYYLVVVGLLAALTDLVFLRTT